MIFMLFTFVALLMPIAAVLSRAGHDQSPDQSAHGLRRWDSVGLLLACSGGLLVCGPSIVYVNFSRNSIYKEIEQDEEESPQ